MAKHHYVPQFYLKRFGNRKYIPAILMNHHFQFVEKASIRQQSCRPNYYKSPEVEHLNGLIEDKASQLMQKITQHTPLDTCETAYLKQYIAFQRMRTPGHVQDMEDGLSKILSSYYTISEGKEGFEGTKPKLTVKNAEAWAWTQIGDMTEAVIDLDLKFLVSKNNNFITSDHPVTIYNPWTLKGQFAGQGYECRGLMLFLPIDSKTTVMLYDNKAYTVRNKNRRTTHITVGKGDEERLNKLQMIGQRNVLYLPRPEHRTRVTELAREVRSSYPPDQEIPMPVTARSDDGRSQIITTESRPINFGSWTFLYESKDWRKVPHSVRGFGIYGSRNSKPNDALKALTETRPWNSTRYIDDKGNMSYVKTTARGFTLNTGHQ